MSHAPYFVSLHHQIRLDENLPALAPLDDRSRNIIRNAAGVLMPKYFSPPRYRQVAAMAPNHFPNLEPRYTYRGKASQSALFCRLGLPHPRTMVYPDPVQAFSACQSQGLPWLPCVLKGDRGGGGSAVFPIRAWVDFEECIQRLPQDQPVLVQEWVNHPGMDLRVVVVGEVTESYFRVGDGGFYNNVAQGGRIDHDIFPEKQHQGQRLARRLTNATGMDLAGLDIMFPSHGPALLIEVNFLFGRKGIGGSRGYDRLFRQAVDAWMERTLICPERGGGSGSVSCASFLTHIHPQGDAVLR